MKKSITNTWVQIVHEYSEALRHLDDDLSEKEMEEAKNTAALAAQKLTGYGYEMARDLDNVQNNLFQKWWFKLFTKLQL